MGSNDTGHFHLTRRRYRTMRPAGSTLAAATTIGAPASRRGLLRIVLTGGPGSGKSTAASFLAREFTDELWVLPESATLLYRGGLPRASSDLGQQIAQRAIYTVQRSLEDASGLQHAGRVQLCDRGTIDGAAYWPDGPDSFFSSLGTSHERELARYDAVIFMHTAATLPAGYERDIEVRTEDREEAIALDERVFALYSSHPRMISVESHSSFLDKLTVVRNAVAELVRGQAAEASQQRQRPPTFTSITGGGMPLEPAPISTLMGLAGVSHVLPTVD